jgi:16S rRNA (cytidine1402-2'-O)-methyltransferase
MGTLYLVATPIGNLEDITLRALRILREVPLIAAEDTRHTRKLLAHFQIATPTISYHEHSGPTGIERVLAALAAGDVALVSDAGTPTVSDPGEALVRAVIAAGYPVVPIPGPSAVVAALIASGLPTEQFTFLGFPPRKSAERRALLEAVREGVPTLVLYEAPHRLLATLDDLVAVLGDRQAALARELTKLHEEWLRGPLSQLRAHYASGGTAPRGEYTLGIAGAAPVVSQPADAASREERARELIRELVPQGLSTRELAVRVADATGLPRRDAYRLALELADRGDE